MKRLTEYLLDVFLEGELISLCVPNDAFALKSNWYSWFNDKKINKFLDQGAFPNTAAKQVEFLKNSNSQRIILIIVEEKKKPVGVISLSSINFQKQACEIAIVMSNDCSARMRPFLGLEAMALMSEHAMVDLGMHRINAGQQIALRGWQNRLELLGYKLEGLHVDKFRKGSAVANSMTICLLRSDFFKLNEARSGCLWDGVEQMQRRSKLLPKKTWLMSLEELYDNERKEYYSRVFDL